MFRLVYFIPIYILAILLRTILILVGRTLVPPMAMLNRYTTRKEISTVNGREILNWKYKWMFVWGNNEDGILAGEEFLDKPAWFRIIYWSAWRNPANNLRFTFLACKIKPDKVRFKLRSKYTSLESMTLYDYDKDTKCFTYLCWQGLHSNFRWQFKMFGKIWRFWIGTAKIYPHDSLGMSPLDYRRFGAGTPTQFKRVWPR